ncbi:MAG: 30S ribosomal protein S6 [Planctomycetota bacterium]
MTERLYEGLFLVDAAEASQGWTDLESSIRSIIDQHGGVIEHAEKWPEQRLAYEVNGAKRGVYFLTYFRSDPQSVAPIRSDAQLSEKIMRLLIIQEPFLEEEMTKRKELAKRRNAEPAPAAAADSAPADSAAADAAPADAADAAEADSAEVNETSVSDSAAGVDSINDGDSIADTPSSDAVEEQAVDVAAENADGEPSDENQQEQN